MRTYIATYFIAVLIGLVLTPLVILLAKRFGVVDAPGLRRVHSAPIPRIGGIAIGLATLLGVLPAMMILNAVGQAFASVRPEVLAILASALGMLILGLVDDLKGLRARFKLFGQLAAAFIVCHYGVRIHSLTVPGLFSVDFGWWSWPLTMFWIVGVTNAVNLIDGLDGLAAGIAAITCAVIAVFALFSGMQVMTVMMLAMLGSLSAFLVYNANPARVFMGDSGSLFVGFMLASSSVLCAAKTQTAVGLALPALAMGVPIFDTLFAMLRRILERRGIMSPDRSHIHHRLVAMGLHHRHVAIILYLVTAVAAGLGLFMMVTRRAGTVIVFAAVLLLLLLVFRLAGAVRLREVIGQLRQNVTRSRANGQHKRRFEAAMLHLSEASDFGSWWQALCLAAETMCLARLSMTVTSRNGHTNTLHWACPSPDKPSRHNMISLTVPCPDRRTGPPLALAIDVPVNGSLEAAGHTAAHLARLMEQYGISTLPDVARGEPAAG